MPAIGSKHNDAVLAHSVARTHSPPNQSAKTSRKTLKVHTTALHYAVCKLARIMSLNNGANSVGQQIQTQAAVFQHDKHLRGELNTHFKHHMYYF